MACQPTYPKAANDLLGFASRLPQVPRGGGSLDGCDIFFQQESLLLQLAGGSRYAVQVCLQGRVALADGWARRSSGSRWKGKYEPMYRESSPSPPHLEPRTFQPA